MAEQLVNLKEIKPNPYQPRTVEDGAAIAEIAVNIYRNGLMQIPSARRVNGHYELVFGHTRKAAYELLATKGVPSADIAPDKRYAQMPLNIHELDDRQMFEMAVAENIKRRDLNPIEQAQAMQRYMQEFSATSKQAAELFGVNDATVRGKVRLLDLPEAAQEKLAKGAISEATARTLVSVQRLLPQQEFNETLTRLEKGVDRWGDPMVPEEIIDNTLDNTDNVVDMWQDRHDGKPRSHWRNGWLLDMKNFPNKMLPEMTVENYAEVFDLKDDTKSKRVWNCIEKAKDDAHLHAIWETSDFEEDHPRAEVLAHLINPPACTACPFYTRVRGSHYCGMKVCYERKTTAWYREIIRAASKDLGIAVYQEEDGSYVILESHMSNAKELFKKRHKDLRLIAKSQLTARGYYSQYGFDGVKDDVFMVVAIGETATKLASKQTVKGTTVDRTAQRRRKLLIEKKKLLLWEMTESTKSLFSGLPKEVLMRLNGWQYLGVDNRPINNPDSEDSEEENEDTLRRMLVWRLIDDAIRFDDAEASCTEFVKELHSGIADWGLKPIKALVEMAKKYDAELNAVSVETGKGKKK